MKIVVFLGGITILLGCASSPKSEPSVHVTTPLVSPPFDWVGVIGTGQSLSVGYNSTAISTGHPFHNLALVDTGPDPKYPIVVDAGAPVWATTPLAEPMRARVHGTGPGYTDGQYPNDLYGESPHSAMASTLTALWAANTDAGTGEYVTAHTTVGWGAHCLIFIQKKSSGRAYAASLNEARVWTGLAAAAGKTYGVGAVVLTHGECDDATKNPNYGTGVYQLWSDYGADLKAITGQAQDVVLLASQESSNITIPITAPVQLWQQGVLHPTQIVVSGPKYAYQYDNDGVHLPGPGYERLGQKYGEVFDQVVNRGVAWKPLQPNAITRSRSCSPSSWERRS
jgi:hypothetical protein